MTGLAQDLRYALRQLRRNPGFSTVAVLMLALGIGANCTIFAVLHAVLLRSLPYPHSERLVILTRTFPGDFTYQTSATKFVYWREHIRSCQSLAAESLLATGVNLTGSGEPERLKSLPVSADWFRTLGVQPAVGRSFTEAEDRPGAGHFVVLSYGLWVRRFGHDRDILGKALRLGNEPYTVVGIMPADFVSEPAVDLWTPLQVAADPARTETTYRVLGRLRRSVSLAQAQQEANSVSHQFRQQYPQQMRPEESLSVMNYRDSLVRDVRLPLLVLQAAVGFVLMIACANLTNLMLSRYVLRRKEVAVRAALGAGRWVITRQFITESLLLALVGGGFGLAISAIAVPVLLRLSPGDIPSVANIHSGPEVWIFAGLIAVLSGICYGILPALQAGSQSPQEVLQHNTGRSSGSRGLRKTQLALIVAEISVSIVLLVGAALLVQTFRQLRKQNPGFDPRHVTVAQMVLDDSRFKKTEAVALLQEQGLSRLEASPGIEAAATISTLPTQPSPQTDFAIEGDARGGDLDGITAWRAISPHYFQVMRIPVLQGRAFTEGDSSAAPAVVIINHRLADRFFPGRNPLGIRIIIGQRPGSAFRDRPREIVGIVGDTREDGIDKVPPPAMFIPAAQVPDSLTALFNHLLALDWVVRSRAGMALAVENIRQQLLTVASQEPVADVEPAEQLLRNSIGRQRFDMLLLACFAILALILGAVGLYGVLSFVVAQQTREIGIRISLGALQRDVLWLVLRHGMAWTLSGIAIGAAGSVLLSRLIVGLLYGVTPNNPAIFAAMATLIAVVALLACYIPARRAAKVDPMVALRYE